VQQLGKCRPHHNQQKWLSTTRGIDVDTLKENQLLVFTDFSATMDLRAGETDNSSVDGHAVLDTFVVLHSPRTVKVMKNDKEIIARVHECDVWHHFGDTISKGKKNDHVFHNACLVDIVDYYRRTFKRDNKPTIDEILLWTDNCAGQYKCNQNFWKIASFSEVFPGISIKHRFAQKYHFKGVWDGAGKVIKEFIRRAEISKEIRFDTAFKCFEELRISLKTIKSQPPWREYERDQDPRILNKTPFKVSRRFFGYGTEDRDVYTEKSSHYQHIVFTDRKVVPHMEPIAGTQKLHSVAGDSDSKRPGEGVGNDQFRLVVASMPCACLACRGRSTQKCPYEHIRNEEVLWVRQKSLEDVVPRNAINTAVFQQYEAELKTILDVDNITVKCLTDALRQRNLPLFGLKHEKAERLVRYHRILRENPAAAPLACEYIVDDDEIVNDEPVDDELD
jgi:hypothetical protein